MPLTKQQKSWLAENYHSYTPATAAAQLGVTPRTVYDAAYRMGITKPKERGRKPEAVLTGQHKGFNKAQLQNQQRFETKRLDLSGKIAVRIDRRTVVYANPGDKIKDILKKYKPLSCN